MMKSGRQKLALVHDITDILQKSVLDARHLAYDQVVFIRAVKEAKFRQGQLLLSSLIAAHTMEVKTNLGYGLHKSIGTLWKGDDVCDFTVVVDGTSFRCHRFILSACSDFFQALFRSQMRESHKNQVKLQGMTASTFDVIINSVYKGVDGLTKDNVLDVWSATEQLQISYLTVECKHFAINNVTVDNCFSTLRHSRLYPSEKVESNTLVFISKQFEQLRKMENLLKLSFADFYRVIESDYLTASSEDVVVETVLKWVDYTHLHSSDCTSNCKEPDNSNCKEPDNSNNLNVSYTNCNKEEINNSASSTLAEVNLVSDLEVMPGHYQEVSLNDILVESQSKRRDRKQHLFTLISTCRLYLVSPSCLDNLLHSPTLASRQGALNLVSGAMMYKLCVERRHETWPEAAVHRVTSNMKHVMVFLSNKKFMAYNLNSGSVHEFAILPYYYTSGSTFTVFDNVLYLVCVKAVLGFYKEEKSQGAFHMFVNQRWEKVNSMHCHMNYNRPYKLLVHNNCIFYLGTSQIWFCQTIYGQSRKWYLLCDMSMNGDIAIFFQQYILSFSTKPNSPVEVMYCNIKTKKTGKISSSMDGTSKRMVSFTHHGDVFLLQRNGSLWKIFSTDIDLVDFELISKLWDGDVDLKGCVVYRKELFVFHQKSSTIVHSVPLTYLGSFTCFLFIIKMVAVNSESSCLPMVLPQSWFIF